MMLISIFLSLSFIHFLNAFPTYYNIITFFNIDMFLTYFFLRIRRCRRQYVFNISLQIYNCIELFIIIIRFIEVPNPTLSF